MSKSTTHSTRCSLLIPTLLAISAVACGGVEGDLAPPDAFEETGLLEETGALDEVEAASRLQGIPEPPACVAVPAYSPATLDAANTSASFMRPKDCAGWSGLQVTFNTTAAYPYRKMYGTAGFDVAGLPSPAAKCQASRLEVETYDWISTIFAQGWKLASKQTKQGIWSAGICYAHNYNGGAIGPSSPGTYLGRVRTRGVLYDGTIVNTFSAARLQAQSIP